MSQDEVDLQPNRIQTRLVFLAAMRLNALKLISVEINPVSTLH